MAADEAVLSGTSGGAAAVLVSVDAGYVMPLAVTLRSLGEGLASGDPVTVFILHSGIDDVEVRRVEASLAGLPLVLRWVAVPVDAVPGTVRLTGHAGVPATYYRLLFDRYLPAGIARVLYLDVDVLVRGDVADLLAADIPQTACAVRIKPRLGQLLGFVPAEVPDAAERPAFNAGVMLIDRRRWAGERVGERALALASQYGERFRHWDQDALNVALAGAWTCLPDAWNHRPDPYRFPSWSDEAPAATPPLLVHFAGPRKPWQPFCDYVETRAYFAVLDRTAWSGWRPARATLGGSLWERWAERSHRRLDRLRELSIKARRAGGRTRVFRGLIAREVVRRPWLALTYPLSRRDRTIY